MFNIGMWSITTIDTEQKAKEIINTAAKIYEIFYGEKPEVSLESTPPGHGRYYRIAWSEGCIEVTSRDLWPMKVGRFIFASFEITPRNQRFATSLAYVISSLHGIGIEIGRDESPEIIRFTPTDEETTMSRYSDENKGTRRKRTKE